MGANVLPAPPEDEQRKLPRNAIDAAEALIGHLAETPFVRGLAPIVALAIPILPCIGALARVLALDAIGVDSRLAVTYPLGGLVLTGAGVFLYPIYGFLLMAAGSPTWRGLNTTKFLRRTFGRSWPWIKISVTIITLLAVLALVAPWPAQWLLITPTLLVTTLIVLGLRAGGHLSLTAALSILLIGGMLSGLTSGLTANVPGIVAVYLKLAKSSPTASGEYILVGEDDSTYYVTSCSMNGVADGVPKSEVLSLTERSANALASTHTGNLVQVIRGSASPMFVNNPC